MAETVGNLLVKIGADISSLVAATGQSEALLKRIDQSARASAGGFSEFQKQVISVNQALQLFKAVGGTIEGIAASFIGEADAAARLAASIRLVSSSQEEAAATQAQLLALSNETRSGLEETATLYTRVARNTDQLGLSQDDLLQVIKTVNQSLIISGATSAEAAGGVLQLTQAFGQGVLRGQELNSILSSMPTVARILADSLGVPVGQLKALGEAGAITSRLVVQALVGAGAQVNEQFKQIPETAEQAFTVLKNTALDAVGDIDQATGATKALVDAINAVRTAAVASLPAIKASLAGAAESARTLAANIAENRGAAFAGLEAGAGALGVSMVIAAAQSEKLATALTFLTTISFSTTLLAGLAALAGVIAVDVASMVDAQREGNKAVDSFDRLAVAVAHAAARGETLTQAQRKAILAGEDWNKVLEKTKTATDAAGKAAQDNAAKFSLIGEAISKAVNKAQNDVAIFGVAVGQVPIAVGAAFQGVATEIANAVGAIPTVPSDSFITLAQNVNRSALAMTSLGAQSATLIAQMQTLDTTTIQGAQNFEALNQQLAKVREQENIVFKADFNDLNVGLKNLRDEVAKGVDPIKIKTDADSLRAMADAIKAQVAKTNDEGLKVRLQLLADQFLKQLDNTMNQANLTVEGFYNKLRFHPPATIKINPEFQLQQMTAELAAARERLITEPLNVELRAHADQLDKDIAAKRKEIADKPAVVPIDGDTTKVNKKLDEVEARIQTITFGFGQITGTAASGQDIQNTINQLRTDLVAAIQAGDRAAQERLRGSGAEFLKTFGTSAGGLTAAERKQILDIIGPFASVGGTQLSQSFAGVGGFAGDPALAAALSQQVSQQREANQQQTKQTQQQVEQTTIARQTSATSGSHFAVAKQQAATADSSLRTVRGIEVWAGMIATDMRNFLAKNPDPALLSDGLREVQARLEAINASMANTLAAQSRTASATETTAATLASGRAGGYLTNAVTSTVQRTTGVRGVLG